MCGRDAVPQTCSVSRRPPAVLPGGRPGPAGGGARHGGVLRGALRPAERAGRGRSGPERTPAGRGGAPAVGQLAQRSRRGTRDDGAARTGGKKTVENTEGGGRRTDRRRAGRWWTRSAAVESGAAAARYFLHQPAGDDEPFLIKGGVCLLPTPADGAIGSLSWTKTERRRLAKLSRNYRCGYCGNTAQPLPKLKNAGKREASTKFKDEISKLHMQQLTAHSLPSKCMTTDGEKKDREGTNEEKSRETGADGDENLAAAKGAECGLEAGTRRGRYPNATGHRTATCCNRAIASGRRRCRRCIAQRILRCGSVERCVGTDYGLRRVRVVSEDQDDLYQYFVGG